ncbi:MAG TPA: hypothetical protein VGF84_16675 [Micromonosporaceae bacterium]
MITNPAAFTVLCYGDSNTNGIPSDDENYVRLGRDVRWTVDCSTCWATDTGSALRTRVS